MTVEELLARISSRELSEWLAYAGLEPFGPERADLRSGIVAATVANVHRDPKKRRKPYTSADFMPRFRLEQGADGQDWPQQLALVEQLNVAFGGKDLRSER